MIYKVCLLPIYSIYSLSDKFARNLSFLATNKARHPPYKLSQKRQHHFISTAPLASVYLATITPVKQVLDSVHLHAP